MAVAPPIHPPMTEARAYELVLRQQILRPIVRDTEARLREALRTFRSIRATIDALPTAPISQKLLGRAYTAAEKHAHRLRRYHTARLRRTMARFFGTKVDILGDHAIKPLIERSIEDNVDLIKTIPTRYHASLKRDLQRLAGAAPFDEEALSTLLAKSYGSSGYNLRRLSRDQTSKLVGRFTRARQEQLGIRAYRWSTVKDSRVRQTHQDLEGMEFLWERPPSEGHPGEPIQCRCTALAIIRPGRSRAPKPPPEPKPPPPPTPARTVKTDEVRKLALDLVAAPKVEKYTSHDPLQRFWTRRKFGPQKISSVGDKAFDALPGDSWFRGYRAPGDAVEIIEGKWVSQTSWGSGQSFISDPKRLSAYGDNVLEIKLKKGAKVIDYEDVWRLRREFAKGLDDITGLSPTAVDRVREFVADEGRFAAYLGYDAISIPGDGRIVLVNFRSAVIRRSARRKFTVFDVKAAKKEIRRKLDRVLALEDEKTDILRRLQKAKGPEVQDRFDEYGDALRKSKNAQASLLAEVEDARKKTRTAAQVDEILAKIDIPAGSPEAWRTGARQFAETAHPKLTEHLNVRITSTTRRRSSARGTYDHGGKITVKMEPNGSPAIVGHELGHTLEYGNKELFDSAVDLLQAKHAKGPRNRDRARVIDVIDNYFGPSWYPAKYYENVVSPWVRQVRFPKGKRYEHIKATEVVSSALEYFQRDRAKFVEQAPDFFWWVVDRIVLPD